MAFLYTNNEKAGRETRTKIPFTMATRKLKYLELNQGGKRPVLRKL